MTAEQIKIRTTELAAVIEDATWDESSETFSLRVSVPEDDAYESESDAIMDRLVGALPGWQIIWDGSGDTDAYGDCTEDMTLTPPEAL
jgi:hypothetical protein